MQLLGLACIAALAPPAFWGWRLLTDRRLEGLRLKTGLYLAGVAAAAALASLLPAPGSWPLPSGLGGVVGDALLALPRRLLSGSSWGMAATGAGVCDDRNPRPDCAPPGSASPAGRAAEDAAAEERQEARPAPRPRFDDAEGEDEPGFAMVSIGAAIHAMLTVKAMLRRALRRRPKSAKADAAPTAGDAAPAAARAPWLDLRADDDGLTEPGAYAPRAKGGGARRRRSAASHASRRRPAR